MKKLLTLAVLAIALVGCSSSSDEGTVVPGSGVPLNPGGQPQTEQDAQYSQQQGQMGGAMNSERDQAAAAMEAAKAKSGGK